MRGTKEKIVMPIFVKTFLGKRIIVAQYESYYPSFSMRKENADHIKTVSGFSKRKKLFTHYQGKDFQIMETSERESGVFLNDSSENSTSNVFEHTNRN